MLDRAAACYGDGMTKSLIVGGPHDGDWIDVEEARRYLTLAVCAVNDPVTIDCTPPAIVETKRAHYTRRKWRSGDKQWLIWAPPELSDIEVMDKLLHGYRP